MGAYAKTQTISLNYYTSIYRWDETELETWIEAILIHEEIHLILYKLIDDFVSYQFDNIGNYLGFDGIPIKL